MTVELTPRDSQNVDETLRPVSSGGEKWIGVPIPVLDKGFVYMVDYMGDDHSIAQAARVSYGTGTKTVRDDEVLIRYLMRHRHTSPFEMVEFKFHAKMPIFVARQWVRHRTANLNEYSARYSILDNEFYVPDDEVISEQSKDNKQGRGEELDIQISEKVRQTLIQDAALTYGHYEELLEDGVARELARSNLPIGVYTQWYWKIDLHNLLHFLSLRMDEHAQWEIRQYADAMAQIVKDTVPITWKAFEDYRLNAMSLTGPEKVVLKNLLGGVSFSEEQVLDLCKQMGFENKRERSEFVDKLKAMGLINE